jgi:hypothetical protein
MTARKTLISIFGLCFMLASSSGSAAGAGSTLENTSVRLWYEGTGRLSDNILVDRNFALWNIIIGEGSAEENANDALFSIDVRSQGQENTQRPLIMTATDERGRVLARRTFLSVLTSQAGNATMALWIRDIGCAGTVVFLAQQGIVRKSVSLDFNCGE